MPYFNKLCGLGRSRSRIDEYDCWAPTHCGTRLSAWHILTARRARNHRYAQIWSHFTKSYLMRWHHSTVKWFGNALQFVLCAVHCSLMKFIKWTLISGECLLDGWLSSLLHGEQTNLLCEDSFPAIAVTTMRWIVRHYWIVTIHLY